MSKKTNDIILEKLEENKQVVLDAIRNDKTNILNDAASLNKEVKEAIIEVLTNPNADKELIAKVLEFVHSLPDPEEYEK